MSPFLSRRWTTVPEYIELLNYIIEKTENVESPMNVLRMGREFKEKRGAAQSETVLKDRINRFRTRIHSFEHIDTNTKVRMMFALSAPVNAGFLKELREDALVEIDEKNRITHYKASDASLELKGDHSRTAKNKTTKLESKQTLRSWIIDYFENKDDSNAVTDTDEAKEMGHLIEVISEKCENVVTPLNIQQLVKDFKNHFGILKQLCSIEKRVRGYCREIQTLEFLGTQSTVQQLFGLSAKVHPDYLDKLRKEALVNVDEKNRIVYYKANDGSLELRGDHSHSAKVKIAIRESERSHRKQIIQYFKNKNDADAAPENEIEKEICNFIEFITEKCVNVNSPLSIRQLAKDFNNNFGMARSLDFISKRVKEYCREIQTLKFLDTHSKVRQLFALSATLDSDYLTKLRKDAVVEVDDLNRITKYTANDGRLILHGDHSYSAKSKLGLIEWVKKRNAVKNYCNSGGDKDKEDEKENGYSEEDSDEYSSEEFGSEFDSDDENDHLDESEDLMVQSKETSDLDTETPVRNRSELSIENSFDFDPPTEKSHRPEEIEMIETVEETTNPEITENAVIKTRSGRLSKRRHLDSNFSYDLANSSNSGALMGSSSSYPKPAKQFPLTERLHVPEVKKRNKGSNGSSSSKQIGSSSNGSIRRTELDDYDTNYSVDYQVKLEPFRGSIQEDFDEFKKDEDIQEIPKPLHVLEQHNQIEEVSIKVEPEELKIVENPIEDVKPEIAQAHDEQKELTEVPIKLEHEEPVEIKPETSHNPKIKFFKAMQSLIICLDTPSLSEIQSRIHQKIQKLGGPDEVILNKEIILNIDLLIARMSNDSVVNLSNDAESVNFSNFLCYLKAAILNSKISGAEGLVKNISKRIEESQNKRISIGNVENTLLATLDINGS